MVMEENSFEVKDCNQLADLNNIRRLQSLSSSAFFGLSRRKCFVQETFFQLYGTHCLNIFDKKDSSLVGYAEFTNFPNIKALTRNWISWLDFHYCVQMPLTYANSLFFNFFIFNTLHDCDILVAVLKEIFLREIKLQYIITICPPFLSRRLKEDQPVYFNFESYAQVFFPKDFNFKNCGNTQKLYVFVRNAITSMIRFRLALPEDNDDIVEIIHNERPDLKTFLGDYYVAEELLTNEPHKRLIVSEVENVTKGFIWLNERVSIRKLIQNYQLESFGFLLKLLLGECIHEICIQTIDLKRKRRYMLFTSKAIEFLCNENSLGTFFLMKETAATALQSFYDMPIAHLEGSEDSLMEFKTQDESFRINQSSKKLKIIENELKNVHHYLLSHQRNIRLISECQTGNKIVSNAFGIQLLGLDSTVDIRTIYTLLFACFSSFSQYDYGILSIPPSIKVVPSMEEVLKYFTRLTSRPDCTSCFAAFIIHRVCIFGEIFLKDVHKDDADQIEEIVLRGMPNVKYHNIKQMSKLAEKFFAEEQPQLNELQLIRELLDEVLNNPFSDYKFLTIRVKNNGKPKGKDFLIGFVVLRLFLQSHLLKKNFQMPSYDVKYKFCRGEIVILKLHPLFQFESDNIFRQIGLRTGYWTLYYFQPTMNQLVPLANDLVTRMQPIDPNWVRKFYWHSSQAEFIPRRSIPTMLQINFSEEYFSVYHQTLKPTKFFAISEKIVVIGFDDICRSFLRMMIFNWSLTKNRDIFSYVPQLNITVINPPGVTEAEFDVHFFCDICSLQDKCWVNWHNGDDFIKDTILRIDMMKWVKFLSAKIIRIDRENQEIVLEDGCKVAYSCLILFCDVNYGPPTFKAFPLSLATGKKNELTPPFNIQNQEEAFHDSSKCNKLKKSHVNCSEYKISFEDPFLSQCANDHSVNFKSSSEQNVSSNSTVDDTRSLSHSSSGSFSSFQKSPTYPHKILSVSEMPSNFFEDLPSNYQDVNNRLDKFILYYKLQILKEEYVEKRIDMSILIYGAGLKCYEFISFLLQHEIPGSCITLATPIGKSMDLQMIVNNPFIDPDIELILQEMIEDLEVHVKEKTIFLYWTYYKNIQYIESVVFRIHPNMEEEDLLTVKCDFFVSYNKAIMNLNISKVLQEAGIHMLNGKIRIDNRFQTNDHRIFSAGNCVLYDFQENEQHENVCPKELAEKIIRILFLKSSVETKFRQPISCACQLPFGYFVTKVVIPKLYLANHLSNEYERRMTTYKDFEFCRIRLNSNGFVEEILAVSRDSTNFDFLKCIIGKHERLLNNLFSNWYLGKIENFLIFFIKPWTEFISHDKFEDLQNINKEEIIDAAEDVLWCKQKSDRTARREELEVYLKTISTDCDLQKNVINFLKKYRQSFHLRFFLPNDAISEGIPLQ